ncbi:MAG: DNA repair protein RecN [Clostridiales bacterium]|jgi:DNA repair protein RecN (Recombination protein N)|nr:DNA repair protein RecN [Clostridiales bacterium]
MLQSLKIENIAVIENAELELSRGFNVLTGETGAGKSIIIDSINAVLGERTSRDIIRSGAAEAYVTAFFSQCGDSALETLSEIGVSGDGGDIVLMRRISQDGKNFCKINGTPVTAAMLRNLGGKLINIHGQNDSQDLLMPERHFLYIDILAGNAPLLNEYREQYKKLCSLKNELEKMRFDESDKARRIDMLEYQINELAMSEICPGEREELSAKRELFRNAEKVISALNLAYEQLLGGDETEGASSKVMTAADCLDDASEYLSGLREAAEALRSITYDINEYASQAKNALSEIDINPCEMDEIDERLDLLSRLSRKYGATEDDMIAFLEAAKKEREDIEFSDIRISGLEKQIKNTESAAIKLADKLTDRRKAAAARFEEDVRKELDFLDMPGVKFVVKIGCSALSSNGADKIEFMISANPGEEPKPIAKIASGGELSRIMLAVKCVLADKDVLQTMIFDEIDAGVSGRAAQKVAMKLREVSRGRQVICVTHLAQIAAHADEQLLVSKSTRGGKTFTDVTRLDFEGRKREIARITGGLKVTELQLKNAEEMLKSAKNKGDYK